MSIIDIGASFTCRGHPSRRVKAGNYGLPWLTAYLLPCLLALLSFSAHAAKALKVDHILILKKKHELRLMCGDSIVKKYAVALGGGGLQPKQEEGDRRTPEGLYRIDSRNPESRFHLALHIAYPDEADKERARALGVDPGRDIMIHGLGSQFKWLGKRHHRYDWTDGCIAVTDPEIEEIWRLVPNGTPVEIRP